MAEVERQMNEAKLKMLIKFEKIKLLEDYYNVSDFYCVLFFLVIQPG